jgi:hypothetical protein
MVLEDLVKELIGETPVDMAIGIRPISRVERQYNEYQVFKGWRRYTVRDRYGKGKYAVRYAGRCSRTATGTAVR